MTDRDYSREDREISEARESEWQRLRRYIRLDIERRDIGSVLADIVQDPDSYRRRACR